MNKEERNKKILTIVIVIAVLFIGIYEIFFNKNEIIEEKIDTETISLVKDNSRFYTVSSCISKYMNYLSSRDTEKLLILLSSEYKNSNSINSSNIYNYVESINGVKTFIPIKMYVQRISKSIYKYYVKGSTQEETIDSISNKKDFYIIVILNEENMTFEIEPYNGAMFK
ncbi:MAG: hypothetical protein IKL65_05830 [Bacilli bacterium]|nr:hypothetical protein [Bacilli bacterium]